MTDDALIEDFFKVAPLQEMLDLIAPRLDSEMSGLWPVPSNDVGLFVCKIHWDGPHNPVCNWVKIAEYPANPDPLLIQKEIRRVLKLRTYFRSCDLCGEKNPVGWMEGSTCHSCMENDGVAF